MKKLLVSFMLMVSMVLSPAVSFAASENVMKCLKLVTGYDYADAVLTQAASLVEIGIAKTTCTEQLMSLDPVFYSLLGAAIALKNTTTINTKSGCQNLITGTINSALDSSIDEAFGSNLTPQQKADLKNAAANQAQQSLSSIPGFNYWGCACEYAYSGDRKSVV